MNYAGFWLRFVAFWIDWLILAIIISAIHFLFYGTPHVFEHLQTMTSNPAGKLMLHTEYTLDWSGTLVIWLYYTLFECSKWQATIGKQLLGLKVTDENGNRIGIGRSNGRFWSKILSTFIFGIGYLMIAFTSRKQGLHDLIARTLIIRK